MDLQTMTIGAIGLGQMGGGIAANIAKAGFNVLGFDPDPAAQERAKAAGVSVVDSNEALLAASEVVLLCVPGSIAVPLTETFLIPNLRAGQILIDHSTIAAPRAREFGAALTTKGVRYMDMPISGGDVGAAEGALRMFAGGDREIFDLCRPLFDAAGDPEKVDHFGPVGMGQAAKVVQQLTARLPNMARLEVMAFGLRSGLTKEQLMTALDVDPNSPNPYAHYFRMVEQDDKEQLGVLASEWAYYLEAAASIQVRMPMLEGAWDLVKDAEKTTTDNLNRPMPCLWDELMRAADE